MKKYLLLLLPVLLFSNCQKEEPFLFEIPYVIDFDIPAGLGTFDTHIFEFTGIPSRINGVLAQQNIAVEDISRINARLGRFTAIFSGPTYNFIREVIVEVYDTQNQNTNAREVFFRNQIPLNNGDQLILDPSLPDVQEFLLKDNFNIRIELRLQSISPTLVETKFEFSFAVR